MSKKKKIYRAGVIPFFIDPTTSQIYMLFMEPSDAKYGGAAPQIGKGKLEPGETPIEAGFREAKEELGLFGANVVEQWNLGKFLGRTYIFIAKIKDKNQFGKPHFETKKTIWMTPEEFQQKGRSLHRPVVAAATRLIKSREGLK